MQTSTSPPTTTSEPAERETGFRAVTGAESETTSAAVLLTAAYCILWLLLMVFIALTWKRQRALANQLDSLERSLESKLREGSAGD